MMILLCISQALRIHVSSESHSRLVEVGGFYLEERGQVQIKVKKKYLGGDIRN